MESVTKKVQSESIKIYDARIMFSAVIEKDLIAKKRLHADASIFENVEWEKAKVKIQSKTEE